MKLELHKVAFYFFEEGECYEVLCHAFEDNTFAVYAFKMKDDGKYGKGIGSMDIEHVPTPEQAEEFLLKILTK